MTKRPFEPGERVKIVRKPKYNGNPHPQHKKGLKATIDEPDPHYETLEGVLHVGVNGFYTQADCLESLDHPPGPSKKELAEAMASLTGSPTPPDLPDPRIEAWEQGHKMCICTREWDIRAPCKNPYQ